MFSRCLHSSLRSCGAFGLLVGLLFSLASASVAQSVRFEIQTNFGTMRGFLYDDTPGHRDAFVRLAKQKHYDGTLFYRCVKDFVIQGGSADSRNAKPGQHIGYGNEAINIDSEIKTRKHFHKYGALCAPRQPDKVNVFKTSDISQFYIVKGHTYTDEYLTKYEKSVNNPIKKKLRALYYEPHKDQLEALKTSDPAAYNKMLKEIKERIDFDYSTSDHKEFTSEQREAYTTIGGTPQLDGEYTVFGEITEGLDVLNKINSLKTDSHERPMQDVRMTVRIIAE